MDIKCSKCHKKYRPNQANTKIYGPYMKTMCPFCMKSWEGKLLIFAEEQVAIYAGKPLGIITAIKMQKLARFVELNSSDYYKRKRKHAKKREESK